MRAMAEKKAGTTMWKATKVIAILLVVIGIITIVYSIYAWSTIGAVVAGLSGRGFNRTGFNQSGFNRTAYNGSYFNSTLAAGRFASRRAFPLNSYLEGIVIGVLMLLLGILTFKYSVLKVGTVAKK